jgi:hypothetical protein
MDTLTPIYLFSLPRAGSTFTQRVLAAHEAVATATEPHFLLPLLRSLEPYGSYSEYEHQLATWAILEFCRDSLPGHEGDYRRAVRNFALELYGKVAGPGERYFLDKTPRYHLIASELIELFPEGKFIFLWRHPLSAVASMLQTFYDGRWFTYLYDFDYYKGIDNLVAAWQKHADQALAVNYEDLVLEPLQTWPRIFEYVGLDFQPELLEQFNRTKLKGKIRDPHADLPEYQKINRKPVEKWKKLFTNPLRKRWARQYLHWIGAERLELMGYALPEILAELAAIPNSPRYLVEDALRMPYGYLARLFEVHMVRDKWRDRRAGKRLYMHK